MRLASLLLTCETHNAYMCARRWMCERRQVALDGAKASQTEPLLWGRCMGRSKRLVSGDRRSWAQGCVSGQNAGRSWKQPAVRDAEPCRPRTVLVVGGRTIETNKGTFRTRVCCKIDVECRVQVVSQSLSSVIEDLISYGDHFLQVGSCTLRWLRSRFADSGDVSCISYNTCTVRE